MEFLCEVICEIWFPTACYLQALLCLFRCTDFLKKQGDHQSACTVGQLTIHEWGWQKPQTRVVIWRSSFCWPHSVYIASIDTCMYFSRLCYTCSSLSSNAQLDSGCACACCAGMCIYVCESLKFEGRSRWWSWFHDSTVNLWTVRILLCSEVLGTFSSLAVEV